MDTIFALASAHGKAGVAVIRVSGPLAWDAASRLCGTLPAPRQTGLRVLCTPDGTRLDEALVLAFEEKASFTGERVVSPSGIEAWLVESHAVPMISMDFSFESGAALDLERIVLVTLRTDPDHLNRGAGGRDPQG